MYIHIHMQIHLIYRSRTYICVPLSTTVAYSLQIPYSNSVFKTKQRKMRDRMERFVLLPFTTGCISESSIAVGLHHHQQQQQAKRSKVDTNSTPTRNKDGYEEDDEEDDESLSGEKSPSSLSPIPRFQKLFKNFKNLSQLFAYKDEFEEAEEGMEIGLPTNVKHVTHIGLDGCASSILSKGWDDLTNLDMINHPSFPLTPLELAMAGPAEKHTVRSLLETK